jgi:hypothetical protein
MNSGEPESPGTGSADWAAIGRYLAGESDSADGNEIREWLLASPDDAAAIQALEAAIRRAAERSVVDIDVDAAFASFKQRRTGRAVTGRQSSGYRRSVFAAKQAHWYRPVPLAVAAAACLLLVVGVVWRGRERIGSAVVERPAISRLESVNAIRCAFRTEAG